MNPHPDFAGRPLPKSVDLGRFKLEVLSPDHVEEDYAAVIESTAVLDGLFEGDWPKGLTLEENLEDLRRHEREFDAEYAFAWIIRAQDGLYLGCAYLVPKKDQRGQATVYTWIRERTDRLELLAAFNEAFSDWLNLSLPKDYALSWISNDWAEQGKV